HRLGRHDRRRESDVPGHDARAVAVGIARGLCGSADMEVIYQAFLALMAPNVLLVVLLASVFGLFVGAIPGLTATMAVALLVPVTFFMEPLPAIAAIVSASAMAIFAGDIPSVLLRIPGTPASAAYTDAAYRLTLRGKAELVLGVC